MLAAVPRPSPARRRPLLTFGAACALSSLALAGCAAHGAIEDPLAPTILVSVDACGQGWSAPTAGQQRFTLRNIDSRAGEVYLTDAVSGAVYADVDPLGAGASTELDISLTAGRYAFRCAMEDEATVTGAAVTITGDAPHTTPAASVSQADLIPATLAYQKYVASRLPILAELTESLRRDLDAGDLARAQIDWVPAHVEYERLGAAYGAFGDLDDRINGLPSGLAQGTADPGWTGFHRVEYGLWHDEGAASLAAAGDALAAAVDELSTSFATAQIDPLQISIRAHEITENALQFELTRATDFGSHSNLATVAANLEGTATVLDILEPLLTPRDPDLPATRALLRTTQADVAAAGSDLDAAPTPTRERLDADLSQLAEDLAPVASLLEPRRVTQ